MRTSLFAEFPDREETTMNVIWDDREIDESVGDCLGEIGDFLGLLLLFAFIVFLAIL